MSPRGCIQSSVPMCRLWPVYRDVRSVFRWTGLRQLLAGVEQAPRVEQPLDPLVERDRGGWPLVAEVAVLDLADAVLAGDRPAELVGAGEELVGGGDRAGARGGVGAVEQEARVQVAVAGVAPGAGIEAVLGRDGERELDRLAEPLDRDADVFADLAAV